MCCLFLSPRRLASFSTFFSLSFSPHVVFLFHSFVLYLSVLRRFVIYHVVCNLFLAVFFLGRFSYYVFCVCVCVYYTCRREEKNMNTQFVLYTLIAYVNLFLNRTKDKQQQKPCIHMPYENKTPINPVVYILAIESIIGKIG